KMTLSEHIIENAATKIARSQKKLTDANFLTTVLQFRDRQAGIGVVYDPELDRYFYNAYCLETKLLKELFSCEYEDLYEALEVINSEFGTWETYDFQEKKGCGSCVAK